MLCRGIVSKPGVSRICVDAGRKLETVRVILCEEDRSAVPYPPFPQSARIAQEGIGRRREA